MSRQRAKGKNAVKHRIGHRPKHNKKTVEERKRLKKLRQEKKGE